MSALLISYDCEMAVKWQDHRTNKDIRMTVQQQETIVAAIRNRKLQLFGHICRMHYCLLKSFWDIDGDHQPGRPRRWIDDILKWCSKDLRGATLMISDRSAWRKFNNSR